MVGACVHASASPAPPGSPAGAGAGTAGDLELRPATDGAEAYGVPLADAPGDPLRDAVRADVLRLAQAEQVAPPLPDPRLDRAAEDLAHAPLGDRLPPADAVTFLVNHHGLIDPPPHLITVRVPPGSDLMLREETADRLPQVLRAGEAGRIGIGVHRSATELRAIVAVQARGVDLRAIPRRLPSGGRAAVVGRLLGGRIGPRLVVTAPDGSVGDLGLEGGADGFRGEFRCANGNGRYQVEVTGDDSSGTAVVANFPLYCGVEPPASHRLRLDRALTVSPAEAERALLALVNADRAAAGLPALAADERLVAIARAHSRDMADHDMVAHVSPRTGNPTDRVLRAGLHPTTVLENVGRAYSAEEAQRGFMSSPGHRANVVDRRARLCGVGVSIGASPGDPAPLYVTELFTD